MRKLDKRESNISILSRVIDETVARTENHVAAPPLSDYCCVIVALSKATFRTFPTLSIVATILYVRDFGIETGNSKLSEYYATPQNLSSMVVQSISHPCVQRPLGSVESWTQVKGR
jgi:hypothetical protein